MTTRAIGDYKRYEDEHGGGPPGALKSTLALRLNLDALGWGPFDLRAALKDGSLKRLLELQAVELMLRIRENEFGDCARDLPQKWG